MRRMASYGSLPEVMEALPAPARRSGNWRRAGAAAVAALACLAAVGVMAAHQREPVALAAGCDEIECLINSPTKPPGAIKVPPRTLKPEEVEKLKAALLEEEGLESKVSSPYPAASARHPAACPAVGDAVCAAIPPDLHWTAYCFLLLLCSCTLACGQCGPWMQLCFCECGARLCFCMQSFVCAAGFLQAAGATDVG